MHHCSNLILEVAEAFLLFSFGVAVLGLVGAYLYYVLNDKIQ
jgi:hypothetical protein